MVRQPLEFTAKALCNFTLTPKNYFDNYRLDRPPHVTFFAARRFTLCAVSAVTVTLKRQS